MTILNHLTENATEAWHFLTACPPVAAAAAYAVTCIVIACYVVYMVEKKTGDR